MWKTKNKPDKQVKEVISYTVIKNLWQVARFAVLNRVIRAVLTKGVTFI